MAKINSFSRYGILFMGVLALVGCSGSGGDVGLDGDDTEPFTAGEGNHIGTFANDEGNSFELSYSDDDQIIIADEDTTLIFPTAENPTLSLSSADGEITVQSTNSQIEIVLTPANEEPMVLPIPDEYTSYAHSLLGLEGISERRINGNSDGVDYATCNIIKTSVTVTCDLARNRSVQNAIVFFKIPLESAVESELISNAQFEKYLVFLDEVLESGWSNIVEFCDTFAEISAETDICETRFRELLPG